MSKAVNTCLIVLSLTSLLSVGYAIENGGTIHVNLSSLNSSNNVFKTYEILQGSADIFIDDIPFDFGYLLIQVHCFKQSILLSNTSDFTPDTYVNGTNIGLIFMRDLNASAQYYLSSDSNVNKTILLSIVGHDIKDPIPGGCNLTFDVKIAPFQKITNEYNLVRVDAQAPALYDGFCPEGDIRIEMYHMYLEEWDLTEAGYFAGIEKMLTANSVELHGRKVPKSRSFPVLRRYYAAYVGTGSVYSIIANFRGFKSAYVPAVSYGCDVHEDCYETVSIYWKVLYGFMVFFGLFMCFKGHRFFQVSLFFTGYFVAAVFTYIILAYMQLTDEERIISLSVIGAIYGAFWVTMWWKFGIPILSVTLSFMVAGYLIASIFFYIGLADVAVFQNDINYWSVLIGITLLVTFALLILSHLCSNILTTSFLGAYIMIVPFDYYIGGNIRYIFLNTLHRATVPNYNLAVIDPPIQSSDQNLLISWVLVAMIGMYAQWKQNKGRAPFPPPPTSPRLVAITENTPLLGARYA
ncbi:hypothetical protein Trydic_g20735 [Trypoxylus dichotomus]